jgi:hypothetical protein
LNSKSVWQRHNPKAEKCGDGPHTWLSSWKT